MDSDTNAVEVLSRERSGEADSTLVLEYPPFTVIELELTPDRLMWLWQSMSKFRVLFSDLTRGDFDNFVAMIGARTSFWMEVRKDGQPLGVIYLEHLDRVTDCEAHINFFDGIEKLDEKIELCQTLLPVLMKRFHLRRISACIPRIYWRTVKFAKHLGFKSEGMRRDVYRIGGQWVNEILLGVTRGDLDGRID